MPIELADWKALNVHRRRRISDDDFETHALWVERNRRYTFSHFYKNFLERAEPATSNLDYLVGAVNDLVVAEGEFSHEPLRWANARRDEGKFWINVGDWLTMPVVTFSDGETVKTVIARKTTDDEWINWQSAFRDGLIAIPVTPCGPMEIPDDLRTMVEASSRRAVPSPPAIRKPMWLPTSTRRRVRQELDTRRKEQLADVHAQRRAWIDEYLRLEFTHMWAGYAEQFETTVLPWYLEYWNAAYAARRSPKVETRPDA